MFGKKNNIPVDEFPKELIPEPVMTLKRFREYAQMILSHPGVETMDSWNMWANCQAGDSVTVTFHRWNKIYNIDIVEDFNWDAFEDLRAEWENPVHA